MSRQPSQPARPAFTPLQPSSPSHSSSYSSSASLTSRTSTSTVPLNSPTTSQQQHLFGTMNQQAQQPHVPQRHPSFEYQPNRAGAGQTAAETTNYLSQMALLNEAAKRAQIAVVMRDIEGMEL